MFDTLSPLSVMTSGLPTERRCLGAKRLGNESEVPRCKKRKKILNWPKKSSKKCKNSDKKIRPKPEAPFNSTQFIMEEHDCLNDSDLSSATSSEVARQHRDSSTSMDSDDPTESLYPVGCSEEQDTFLSEQFWSTYHDLNAERLHGLTKAQLVQEHFAVEEKLNILERELVIARTQDRTSQRIREPSPEYDETGGLAPGEVPVDAETAAKIEVFRNEINKLTIENDCLRVENESLRRKVGPSSTVSCRRCADESSSSDDASSSDSSDSYSSDTSSDECVIKPRKLLLLSTLTKDNDDVRPSSSGVLSIDKVIALDVSDSGIASASSGDDLKLDERDMAGSSGVQISRKRTVVNKVSNTM